MFEIERQAKEEQWSLQEFIYTLYEKFEQSHSDQFLVSQEYFDSIEDIKEWLERDWDPDEAVFYLDCNPESTYKPS